MAQQIAGQVDAKDSLTSAQVTRHDPFADFVDFSDSQSLELDHLVDAKFREGCVYLDDLDDLADSLPSVSSASVDRTDVDANEETAAGRKEDLIESLQKQAEARNAVDTMPAWLRTKTRVKLQGDHIVGEDCLDMKLMTNAIADILASKDLGTPFVTGLLGKCTRFRTIANAIYFTDLQSYLIRSLRRGLGSWKDVLYEINRETTGSDYGTRS